VLVAPPAQDQGLGVGGRARVLPADATGHRRSRRGRARRSSTASNV